MNANLAYLIETKTLAVANEARLLKKCFLGLSIIAMAFQATEFGAVIRQSLVDAIYRCLFLLVLHFLYLLVLIHLLNSILKNF